MAAKRAFSWQSKAPTTCGRLRNDSRWRRCGFSKRLSSPEEFNRQPFIECRLIKRRDLTERGVSLRNLQIQIAHQMPQLPTSPLRRLSNCAGHWRRFGRHVLQLGLDLCQLQCLIQGVVPLHDDGVQRLGWRTEVPPLNHAKSCKTLLCNGRYITSIKSRLLTTTASANHIFMY